MIMFRVYLQAMNYGYDVHIVNGLSDYAPCTFSGYELWV